MPRAAAASGFSNSHPIRCPSSFRRFTLFYSGPVEHHPADERTPPPMHQVRRTAALRSSCVLSCMSPPALPFSSTAQEPVLLSFRGPLRSRSFSSPLFLPLSSPSRSLSVSAGPPSTGGGGASSSSSSDTALPSSSSPPSFLTRFPWLLRLMGYYGSESTRLRLSDGLFRSCLAQSRLSPFYTVGRVKRDFRSRHLLLSLHVWVVHRRILRDIKSAESGLSPSDVVASSSSSSSSSPLPSSGSGSGKPKKSEDDEYASQRDARELKLLQEALFDRLWDDTMVRIREQKVPEMSVNSSLKTVQKYTFASCISLDHAQTLLAPSDVGNDGKDARSSSASAEAASAAASLDELGGALWRDVYCKNDVLSVDHVHRLALYASRELDRVLGMEPGDFYAADIPWGKPPDWEDVLGDDGRVAGTGDLVDKEKDIQDVEAKGGVAIRDDEDLKEGWASALSPAGKVYYWNKKSKETSWNRPTKN